MIDHRRYHIEARIKGGVLTLTEKKMYDIYEKEIKDSFAGMGIESLIVENGIILAHTRGWSNPTVMDDDWQAPLTGKPVNARGKGWHKLRRSRLRNAQAWARDLIE